MRRKIVKNKIKLGKMLTEEQMNILEKNSDKKIVIAGDKRIRRRGNGFEIKDASEEEIKNFKQEGSEETEFEDENSEEDKEDDEKEEKNLNYYKKKELQEMCDDKGIEYYDSDKKSELIEKLSE